jgi:hypothetical protein
VPLLSRPAADRPSFPPLARAQNMKLSVKTLQGKQFPIEAEATNTVGARAGSRKGLTLFLRLNARPRL